MSEAGDIPSKTTELPRNVVVADTEQDRKELSDSNRKTFVHTINSLAGNLASEMATIVRVREKQSERWPYTDTAETNHELSFSFYHTSPREEIPHTLSHDILGVNTPDKKFSVLFPRPKKREDVEVGKVFLIEAFPMSKSHPSDLIPIFQKANLYNLDPENPHHLEHFLRMEIDLTRREPEVVLRSQVTAIPYTFDALRNAFVIPGAEETSFTAQDVLSAYQNAVESIPRPSGAIPTPTI